MAIRSTFGKMEKMDLMTNLGHFETLKIDRITILAILNIKKRKHYQFLQFCTQLLTKMSNRSTISILPIVDRMTQK